MTPPRPARAVRVPLTGIALAAFPALVGAQGVPPTSDRAQIERVVQDYFAAVDGHDRAILDRAFHPNAQLAAAIGGYWERPYEEWATFTRSPVAADVDERRNHVVSVDVAGSAATAKVILEWPSVRYVDYLTILKTDLGWRIVNKVWHQQPRWLGEFADAPTPFFPPPLDPTDASLLPEEVAPGVWVLRGDRGAVNNIGLVVGEEAALVVDAHITRELADEAIRLVRTITDLPIRWLANTNPHGDHTFGNAAFGPETTILGHTSHERTPEEFATEVAVLRHFTGKPELFADAEFRGPDQVFEHRMEIDLGGRIVEFLHVGPVNTEGDVLVHVPDAGVAFTGNLLTRAQVPLLWTGDARDWLRLVETVEEMGARLLVPGHLAPVEATAILAEARAYGEWLDGAVDAALELGWSPLRVGEDLALPERFMPPGPAGFQSMVRGFHALNALRTAQRRTPS